MHSYSFKELAKSELGKVSNCRFLHFRVWARSVCMNESLELGSMLPLIKTALKNKVSVIVFNPNFNRVNDVS